MAQQIINIGAAPNDGTGTPMRTAFNYCNLNFTELYTAVGPSGNNIVVPGTATITGAATVGTTLGVTGVSTFAAGTALLPALTTTGDTNTGIYYPAADTFAVTTGGAERYRVDSSGNVGVGLTPRVKLDVNGGLLVNNYGTSSNYAPLSVTTASTITTPSTFTNAINIWNPTTVGAYSNITFGYNALGLTNAPAYIGFVSTTSTSGGFGDLVFGTRSVGTDTAATERLRIDASGNVCIGTTTATPFAGNTKAVVGGGSGAIGLTLYGGVATNNGLYFADGIVGNETYRGYLEYSHTTDSFAFGTAGANRYTIDSTGIATWLVAGTTAMTLDSTGLGIGGSAAYKLDVVGPVMRLINSAATADIFITDSGTTNGNVRLRGESNALKFITGGGVTATIDSSGNVGIGVTPGAWRTSVPFRALQIGYTGAIYGITTSEQVNLSSNYLQDTGGNEVRIQAGYATRYQQSSGQHLWSIAGTSTAGSAITFTQAMVLDTSGNLLVGVASANANGGVLQLKSGITFPATQVAASDANTLDDYEEGTWTPVIADATTGGNVGTCTINSATYTKIGRQVSIQCDLRSITTTGMTGGNNLFIRGLPFASVKGGNGSFYTYRVGRNASTVSSAVTVEHGVSHAFLSLFTTSSANTNLSILVSDITSGTSELALSVTYTV